jgi:hypothetical protein
MGVESILRPDRETSGAIGLLASNSKFRIIEREPDASPLSEHGPRRDADDPLQWKRREVLSGLLLHLEFPRNMTLHLLLWRPHKLCHILGVGYLSLFPH